MYSRDSVLVETKQKVHRLFKIDQNLIRPHAYSHSLFPIPINVKTKNFTSHNPMKRNDVN